MNTAAKRQAFRRLHQSGCFVIPNPWDIGSARLLQQMGFKALATTSSGCAWSRGRADGRLSREEALAHLREIVAATDLPVNADFESGFAADAEGVAQSVRLALAVGVAAALVFTWSKTLEAFFMPLLVSLNMVPKVALGPLIIVWFKYGIFPNTLMAFSICVFPILLTTARGLREIEPELLDLVHSLKGSRWQLFTKIQLPGALPYIFSGMKVAAILAVAGAIVGEFLGSDKGLGYLMLQVQVTLDTPAMFMAVLLITLLGMILYGSVLLLEKLLIVKDARIG